jgi:peptidoglycan/LPS O-acetylase OafA/YrhL
MGLPLPAGLFEGRTSRNLVAASAVGSYVLVALSGTAFLLLSRGSTTRLLLAFAAAATAYHGRQDWTWPRRIVAFAGVGVLLAIVVLRFGDVLSPRWG